MRRDFQIIAGASAAAAAIAFAAQVYRSAPEPAPPLILAETPAPAAPAPPPDRTELTAEITRLTAALNDRQSEYARLQATVDRRDTELDRVTAALAARDAEIRDLRQELEALRAQAAFDHQLAALKAAAAQPQATPASAIVPAPEAAPAGDAPLADIQFESASAALTPGAHMRALAAAATLGTMQLDAVRVIGHADTVGRPEANRALSIARAATVAALLASSGIPRDLIDTSGSGETALPVATADGTPEPLNRSVSIVAVPTRVALN
jgi:outer membrane protein OmpA-like peptidoglycan-associated protein